MTLSQKLTKENVAPFFDKWSKLQKLIEQMHHHRNPEVENEMIKGIALYKQLLTFCNDLPVNKRLEPINGGERLAFIEKKPGIYASFIQLQQLFAELKKSIAATMVRLHSLPE